jgi:hypothetical protein
MLIYGNFIFSSGLTINDISGAGQTISFYAANDAFHCNAGAGALNQGIVIGSGDTPVTKADYSLETIISHGTGSGQLSAGAMTVEAPSGIDPECRMRLIRVFTNSSGDSIVVKEIGLYVLCDADTDTLCPYRHVLDEPITIPDGQSLTVRLIMTYDSTEEA